MYLMDRRDMYIPHLVVPRRCHVSLLHYRCTLLHASCDGDCARAEGAKGPLQLRPIHVHEH
jgi:hypothetical protein